jgi:hypothetical protein
MSSSPFSMKCDTHLHYVRLPSEEKGDAGNTGVYHIRCPCPKISGPALSLTTLSNFSKLPSACCPRPQPESLLSCRPQPWSMSSPRPRPQSAPPPHPRPRAHHPPSSTPEHNTINLKHVAAILDPKPVIVDLTVVVPHSISLVRPLISVNAL